MAKAVGQNGSDGEGRRPGARTGLETPVFPAVNAAGYLLGGLRARPVG